MAVEPYAPCPCGSGEKFKWCCHKVEAYADKSLLQLENGQVDAALATLDEGLRKAPDNPWLAIRKALILARSGKPAQARPLLEKVLAKRPAHVGAQGLLVRVVNELDGPEAGVGQLQKALGQVPGDRRPGLSTAAQLVGVMLMEAGHFVAARRHLELALDLGGDDEEAHPELARTLRMIESNPGLSPWLRNPDRLAPAPGGLNGEAAERFGQALTLACDGLWSQAAAVFQNLAAGGPPEADRNLGLCRLWLADEAAGVEALRRFIRAAGETAEVVDLEALCQAVAEPSDDELVEHVRLIWNVRDRERLLATLRESDRVAFEGHGPLDPDDPNSFEVDSFELLDRPRPPGVPERLDQVPRVLGRVLVAREIVMLDAFDDGKLDALTARFTDLAGEAIPPAQPRTKEIEKVARTSLAMRSEWWLPEDVPADLAQRLNREERARLLAEVWPDTPMPYLRGRTPRKAAEAGDARVALRAAVCQLEIGSATGASGEAIVDFPALRARLGIPEEPEIDPAAGIDSVHVARLNRVPAERLDDDRLVELFARSRDFGAVPAMERAARALVERPAVLGRPEVGYLAPYSTLAQLAAARGAAAEAADWLRRGREADPAARGANAVRWDLLEVRLQAQLEPPETWVPALAVALDRYREDSAAGQVILSALVEMGLMQLVPNPDNLEELLLDSRPLQAMLAEYGPRITTASGGLGISATKGEIWTPGAEGGTTTPGGIWTPGGGGGAAPGGEKKLIVPGR